MMYGVGKGSWGYGGMMGNYEGSRFLAGWHLILATITWLVVIALLVAMTRWFWVKADRKK